MENKNGSGIFLGVIGVATLVVAIIGATFAYFSASAGSSQIDVTSTTVGLGFAEFAAETSLQTGLIPAYDNIASASATDALNGDEREGQPGLCVDDNKNKICSVYTFFVGNPSVITTQLTTTIKLVSENTFTNLYFRVFDITDGDITAEDLAGTSAKNVVTPTNFKQLTLDDSGNHTLEVGEGESKKTFTFPVQYDADVTFADEGTTLTIPLIDTLDASTEALSDTDKDDITKYAAIQKAGTTNHRKYKLVIWLRDTETDQPFDSNRTFAAKLNITTGTGQGVTGVLTGASDDLIEGSNYAG